MAPPALLYSENDVKTETYYVTIDLGGTGAPQPTTGIFVPENYRLSSDVDVILWLMGHHDNQEYPPSLSIDQYWFKYPNFRFRQFVNAGNKNVILVAPTLGASSESGNLTSSGGLSRYLDQVLAALEAYASFSSPSLGNLVIACHSGGGSPMLQIATTTQQYSDNIQQLWGFDCLYGDVEASWLQWAQKNSSKLLLIRYGSSTPDRSRTLMKMAAKQSNINVDGNEGTPHNRVPETYWNRFMRRAHIFNDK